MGIRPNLFVRAAIASGLVVGASGAHAITFSTTETGDWSETSSGGVSNLTDSMVVTSFAPDPGLTFDSAMFFLSSPGTSTPIDGDIFLYGSTTADYLEFSVQGDNAIVTTKGSSTWVTGTGTLIGSGGVLAQYSTGTGSFAMAFGSTSQSGGNSSGVSAGGFSGDVNPAPEPASLAALGLGVGGLIGVRRRRRS